ncbi:hypothetical protein ABZU76_34330, partial [Amycolatopsis sp. NPDC005232]|uniref:hypothetical protein n=1 Tax=Amycolatopsis sp. NPDC005232 TaxID=3157027 RepID=UPI0033ADA89D
GGAIGPRPIRPPPSGSRLKGDLARPGEAGANNTAIWHALAKPGPTTPRSGTPRRSRGQQHRDLARPGEAEANNTAIWHAPAKPRPKMQQNGEMHAAEPEHAPVTGAEPSVLP